ncbi:hypothetical protein [uncultured Maribacter sp.]|uniref:hypothetical protein n=1 Tax=uncultured Maribacter sp. TaxID=431308 RepID=UPI002605AC76|nr:hypothetical protein [uncultured Maribacter sp.]
MISICRKYIKAASYILLLDMMLTIVIPSGNTIYALTSGPASPEFSSFEPVATTNLVDPLSGNFTYNLPVIQIPGPDGGGYAMSLSYHSGASPEEESSWVGHGWTLNPGAINKGVRGLPDEYDNTPVDIYNRTRPNWTLSGSEKLNLEFFSNSGEDSGGSSGGGLGLGVSKYVRYNNFQGLAKTISLSLSKGFGSLSMNRSATGITFSATINPFSLLKKEQKKVLKEKQNVKNKGLIKFDKEVTANEQILASKGSALSAAGTVAQSLFGFKSFTDNGVQTSLSKLKGYNFNTSFGVEINPAVAPVGIETGLTGAFSLNISEAFETVFTYGYENTPSEMGKYRMDYFTEKAQSFDKRDYFIGIPFSTPDNYMLTGEGLSGGFRPYRKSVGNYFPEKIEGDDNKIKTFGLGVELAIGTNVGVGVNLAFGNNKSTIKEWSNQNQFSDSNNDYQYRFYGDMGGKVEYGDTNISKSKLKASPNFPGITNVSGSAPSGVNNLNESEAIGSSFIQKGTNSGFSIYNEAGLKYTYDVDMMVKNTASLSIDVQKEDIVEKNYLAFKNLYLDNQFNVEECQHRVVVGDVKKEGYAATSLLSNIVTSDYIDLGTPGPDESDFGGWTSFEYFKKYGDINDEGNSNWYRWRIPYNGLFYSKNSISDLKDDTGFVTTGEKEINFLKKVETKTHVAYFVTNKSEPTRFGVNDSDIQAKYLQGSGLDRFDGLAAADLAFSDPAAINPSAKNELKQLEYLEKVVLFSKDRPDVPLQTTNFKYDYSLVPNLPNNVNGNFPSNTTKLNSGKLTLRKVWSEFEGVVNARTSSYKFDYRYKDFADYPTYLIDEHSELDSFFNLSNTYSVNVQNPEYSPYTLDAWGGNQYAGAERHLNIVKWPYQGDIPINSFDPAAWQLKQVTLPSGGQILVEYESKDYSYVQDRNVMALVKLISANDNYENPEYTLDLSDIGYNSTEDADKIQELYEYLRAYFLKDYDATNLSNNNVYSNDFGNLKSDNRIYFKLLYALEGSYPDLEDCKSEYLTGYAKVKKVKLNGGAISIELDGSNDGKNLIGVGLFDDPVEDEGYRLTPRQACYDYYVTQRWGKYTAGCESKIEKIFGKEMDQLADCDGKLIDNIGDAVKVAGITASGMTLVSSLAVNSKYPLKTQVCKAINPSLSYLKIPINKAKRGDGMRVKRVLMFDKGIETGDAAIYGQQYNYQLEDGRSSGVATNEPNDMREENPLVGFLPKEDQSWLNRLVAGKDREQSEGPIGESLLPSPSVKHARVVVENIHRGKTGSGHTVYEYFTCRDYPFDKLYDYSQNDPNDNREYDIGVAKPVKGVDYSVLQDESYDDKLRIPTPNFSYSLDKAWASQGFRFIQSGMDGKPKSIRTYGGDYANGNSSFISSGQDFYYYEPGEKVPMLKGNGTYYMDTPGKEMDVTMENFKLKNQILDFNFEIDVSAGLTFPPPIFVSGWLQFSFAEQKLSKYAVSKVIRYPAIQKKIVSYSDNIASITENLGFDNATGRSVVTKTYDAYHGIVSAEGEKHDGSIYSMNIPAHWNYAAMGRKTEDESYTNQLLASSGQVITYGDGANPINLGGTWNIKGDKVISSGANTFNTLAGVTTWIDDNINSIYNSSGATTELEKIWRLHQSFVFKGEVSKSSNRITEFGKIFNGGILEGYTPFNYTSNASQDERWVKLSEVTKYSPNGNALEEEDVLGVPSSSRFGYNFTQPVMIAQNARYDEIYFEHFEDKQDVTLPNLVFGVAHSGQYSQQITSGAFIVNNVISRKLLSDTGGWLKFWTKSENKLENPNILVEGDSYIPQFVAKTGEWSLYRVFVNANSLPINQEVSMQLTFDNVNTTYIDDIKFNPKESQTTCFVYDVKSLRLLTLFDDQHFGLYYQYNNEGQLVRKLIETEKGLKTITETQYNTPREDREDF